MGNVMTFEPERSNHVARLTYDPDEQHLTVTFKNGSNYHHVAVPPPVFAAMTRHPSVGEYYHRVIKRHYARRADGTN